MGRGFKGHDHAPGDKREALFSQQEINRAKEFYELGHHLVIGVTERTVNIETDGAYTGNNKWHEGLVFLIGDRNLGLNFTPVQGL